MSIYRYVISEEPTALEPTKLPRLVGRTNDIAQVQGELGVDEVLVTTTELVNLNYWQNPPFRWWRDGEMHTEDTALHQRRWVVEYNGGDYQVVETDPPLISQTKELASISGSLTIT